MSEPLPSLLAAGRHALISRLAACGMHGEEADAADVVAAAPVTRCVERVGDRQVEVLRIDSAGRFRYEAGWLDVAPFEEMPDFEREGPRAPVAVPSGPAVAQAHPEWRVCVSPAGDRAGRHAFVTIEGVLADSAEVPEQVRQMRAIARSHDPAPAPVPAEEASYYLMTPQVVALFRETIADQVVGWGTFEIVAGESGPAMERATVEQADSRGDRYRYDVIRTQEGVAAEVHGAKDLVVHDWIWRFPIQDRAWTEDVDGSLVSLQVYHVEEPVDVPAGRFWGCVRLSTMNENGSSVHTYHPQAGLILSEFTDVEGTPGRRELFDLVRRVP